MRARLAVGLACLLGAGTACRTSGQEAETIRTSAEYVLTLQSGTARELKERRNQGPFETYELSPETMLVVLESAMRRAGPEDEPPFVKVYVSARYGEVLAKEFGQPHQGYADPFRSAALAIVHSVPGEPDRSRVEIHAIHRGPFHRGRVRWETSLPGWIDAAIEDRSRVRRLP